MKAPKPPTLPPDPTPETPPSAVGSDTWEDGPNRRSDYRRLIYQPWAPKTIHDARSILEETMAKAGALTSLLKEYTSAMDDDQGWGSDLSYCLELLDDLLDVGYGMIEWWDTDETELIQAGWTPPQGTEVQP